MVTGIQTTSGEYPGRNGTLDESDQAKSKKQLCEELAMMRQRIAELGQSNSGYYGTRRVLHKAVQQYREVIDYAALGFFQSTPSGRYLMANLAFAQLLGYDSSMELMDAVTDIPHQVFVDPSQGDRFHSLLESEGAIENFEYQAHCKDGQIIWLCTCARVVRDTSGAVAYYEGSVLNVTHYKQTIEQLSE